MSGWSSTLPSPFSCAFTVSCSFRLPTYYITTLLIDILLSQFLSFIFRNLCLSFFFLRYISFVVLFFSVPSSVTLSAYRSFILTLHTIRLHSPPHPHPPQITYPLLFSLRFLVLRLPYPIFLNPPHLLFFVFIFLLLFFLSPYLFVSLLFQHHFVFSLSFCLLDLTLLIFFLRLFLLLPFLQACHCLRRAIC